MGKFPVYAILAGMLLVLASCVPVAGSLYRMAVPTAPAVFELPIDGKVRLAHETGGADHLLLALIFDMDPRESRESGIRFRAVITGGGGTLQQVDGSVAASEVASAAGVVESDGHVRVEKRLPVIALPEGLSSIVMEIDIDARDDHDSLIGARVAVRPDPPRFALSFVNTAVVWTLGTLLVLIGAIQWGRQVASVEAAGIPSAENERDQRVWCMLCHLSALLGYIVPFAHVLAPLLIWIAKRNTTRGIDDAGRESLNFQLTVSLFGLVGIMLSAVFIGLVMLFTLVVFHFCMTLVAALRAQRGESFRYPLTLRIVGPVNREL